MLSIKIHLGDFVPPREVLAEAAGRGVENLVIQHLRDRNASRAPNRNALPKSNYWADAAKDVSTTVTGAVASVAIEKPGVALHYHGGTVYPKKKALAIPLDPSVATIWPSEVMGDLDVFWPKNASHGFLKDPNTGNLLYLLIRKATLRPDPSVLPTDGDIASAAEDALMEAVA